MVCRSKGGSQMILSHKESEEIAAAVTKDFNEFFFGPDTDGRRLPRGTPIDQFAREYLCLLYTSGSSESICIRRSCEARLSVCSST